MSLRIYAVTEGADDAWNEGFMDLVNNQYGRRVGCDLDVPEAWVSSCDEIWEQEFPTRSPRQSALQWSEAGW